MSESPFPIGRRITLRGHFAEPVAVESVCPLGDGCECRVRSPDGSLEDETIHRVAHEKLTGFDYRAQQVLDLTLGTMEVRRIEVKGYTEGNPIQLEHSEWTKAQQLGDTCWLYVVWNPLSPNHRLVKIQNPYRVLEHAVKQRQIIRRYEIASHAIDTHGGKGRR